MRHLLSAPLLLLALGSALACRVPPEASREDPEAAPATDPAADAEPVEARRADADRARPAAGAGSQDPLREERAADVQGQPSREAEARAGHGRAPHSEGDPARDGSPLQASGFGPEAPAEWKVITPREGDTFSLQRANPEPVDVVDTIVQASPRTALICYQGRGPFRDYRIRNSILRVEPGTIPLDRSYWAFRGYDMIDTLVESSEITGFGVVTDRHDEGHAIYLNVAGAFTVRDCHFHHNGGQAIQLVNRPAESVLPPGPAQGAVVVENTRIAENGFNPDRGGFQVSVFGTGQPITFRGVDIVAGLDGTTYPRGRTGGGLVIEAEAPGGRRAVWWKPAAPPEGWEVPFTQGPTLLERVTVHHRDPDKPIVQIKGCEELLVRDSWFGGGKVVLDHPAKPGRDCGRIVWEGNAGDAELWVRGTRVGPVDRDYEF